MSIVLPVHSTAGYYELTVHARGSNRLLRTNNERLFIISQLKNTLEYRARVSSVPVYRQLSTCIDLLAYNISEYQITLIGYTITQKAFHHLLRELLDGLREYRYTYNLPVPVSTYHHLKALAGPHDCLHQTIVLHTAVSDWEYSRYTSIGFYMHDRRGDWMRLWRMSRLYNGSAATYQQLIARYLGQKQASPYRLGRASEVRSRIA